MSSFFCLVPPTEGRHGVPGTSVAVPVTVAGKGDNRRLLGICSNRYGLHGLISCAVIRIEGVASAGTDKEAGRTVAVKGKCSA